MTTINIEERISLSMVITDRLAGVSANFIKALVTLEECGMDMSQIEEIGFILIEDMSKKVVELLKNDNLPSVKEGVEVRTNIRQDILTTRLEELLDKIK